MAENETENLEYQSVEPLPATADTFNDDGALYDADGKPVPADNLLFEKPVQKKKFTNEFLRGARIPRGSVTVDENGLEIDGKLNTDKAPMDTAQASELAAIMGEDFVKAFGSGKAIENNKTVKISKYVAQK